MNRYTNHQLSRRSLLQAAGGIAAAFALGDHARARGLLLVATTESDPISQVEWIVYDTGLMDLASQPLERVAVRLTTTGGAQGWADFESWTMPDFQTTRLIESVLLGQDPANHENIWKQLYAQAVPLGALGAIDVALWDLRGRVEGRPVHALLGTRRQQVPCYVSTGFDLGEPSAYAEFASNCQEQGTHGVKVQPASGSVEGDIAVYAAVRNAVGPDFPCLAGGAAAYTYEQALLVGRELDELGYAWYQSPMPENDAWAGPYAMLAGELQTPICAPQANPGSYQSRITWIERAACDIPCIDVHHGGLTACVQLASICQAKGIGLELPHVGPDAYAHLQIAGAAEASAIPRLELLSLTQEAETSPGRITPEPLFDETGHIAVPQTPGMGLELDWKYIFTHRVS